LGEDPYLRAFDLEHGFGLQTVLAKLASLHSMPHVLVGFAHLVQRIAFVTGLGSCFLAAFGAQPAHLVGLLGKAIRSWRFLLEALGFRLASCLYCTVLEPIWQGFQVT
jgi:hypothetical protein